MFGDIRNPRGEKLDYDYQPGRSDDGRIVVLGHGVTGNKDRPVVVAAAESLEKAGIATVRFSFSGNGESEGRFEESTISKEVDDLGAILDALDGRRIAYAGHSMGGAVGVLRAAADDRIEVLVSIAGMVDTAGFAQREFGEETPDQGCMWEDEQCPLSSTFMNDMAAIGSVLSSGSKVSVPWLLVHGSADDVVPPQDSHDIHAVAREPKKLVIVEGADHSFGAGHESALGEAIVAWVEEHLR